MRLENPRLIINNYFQFNYSSCHHQQLICSLHIKAIIKQPLLSLCLQLGLSSYLCLLRRARPHYCGICQWGVCVCVCAQGVLLPRLNLHSCLTVVSTLSWLWTTHMLGSLSGILHWLIFSPKMHNCDLNIVTIKIETVLTCVRCTGCPRSAA